MKLSLLTCVVVAVPSLVAPCIAQDKKDIKKSTGVVEASAKKKATPLDKLLRADEKARPKALINFIEDQVSTNSFYAGQYRVLVKVDGAAAMVGKWIKQAPLSVFEETPFRAACVRALRDLHGKQAPETVMKDLLKIVADQAEAGAVRQEGVYALAQFGDRRFVDNMIAQLTKQAKAESAMERARGHSGLANVYYQIREFDKAVDAYKAILALHESGAIDLGQRRSVTLYNTACSAALGGKKDLAFEYLGKAMKLGGLNPRMLREDMDIASLRSDPRFAELTGGKKPADGEHKGKGEHKGEHKHDGEHKHKGEKKAKSGGK